MYNTDRMDVVVNIDDIMDYGVDNPEEEWYEFVAIEPDGIEIGKGWARGYVGDYPNPLYNVGTGFGRHPFDIRVLLRSWNLIPWLIGDLIQYRKEAGVR